MNNTRITIPKGNNQQLVISGFTNPEIELIVTVNGAFFLNKDTGEIYKAIPASTEWGKK